VDTRRMAIYVRGLERLRSVSPANNKMRGKKSAAVGRTYEKLLRVLLDGCSCLAVQQNITTTTSEMDFLLAGC
jgi:hypothetical protein